MNKDNYKKFLENIATTYITGQETNYDYILEHIIKTPSKLLVDLTLFNLSLNDIIDTGIFEITENSEITKVMQFHWNLPHIVLALSHKDFKYFKLFLLILIKSRNSNILFIPYYESHSPKSTKTNIYSDNLINYLVKLMDDKSFKIKTNNILNKIIENNLDAESLYSKINFISKHTHNQDPSRYDTIATNLKHYLDFKKPNKLTKIKYFKNLLAIDLDDQIFVNPLITHNKTEKSSISNYMQAKYPNIFCNSKKLCTFENSNSNLSSSTIKKILQS